MDENIPQIKPVEETQKEESQPEKLKLTLKQREFLKLYFKTGNGVQSAMKVYDTDDYDSACSIASQNLSKLKVPIQHLMEAKGLSLGDLIDTVLDARKAMKKTPIITGRDAKGAPMYEYVDEPDHFIRLKSVEIAGRWLGIEKPDTKVDIHAEKVVAILGGVSNVQNNNSNQETT